LDRIAVTSSVRRSLPASGVAAVLEELARSRGLPGHIRSDNGPEFIAAAIRGWLAGAGVGTLYVEPGSPWENGYAESFHSRLRDEFLGAEVFTSLLEARVLGAEWRRAYNQELPHRSLGYKTPAAFAAGCPRHAAAKPSPSRGHKGSD
jgi:transposase InsO family protein